MPEPDALTARELAAYEKRLAEDLSEQEQTAMQERDPVAYKEWLDTEQRHVPMPSRQKPAINGFREGDRVRLTQPFKGETVSYEAGHKGVFLTSNTAPAMIRLVREVPPLYELLMDWPDSQRIGVSDPIERIHGHFQVDYIDGFVNASPAALADGEQVRLQYDCEINNVPYSAGTVGTLCYPNDLARRGKLASENQYAIVLDSGKTIVVPGYYLRPIW
jgi:hypothetical protein